MSGRNAFLASLVVLLLIAGAASLLPAPGVAQESDPNPSEAPLPDDFDDPAVLGDEPGIRDELGITDAQREQLRALRRDALKKGIRNRAEWRVKQIELQELLAADTPDPALVERKVGEIGDLQHQMLRSRVDTRLALAGILTPEQRSKLRRLARQRMRARGRGFGRHGFRRRGFRRGERGFGFGRRGFGRRHREHARPEHRRPEAPPPPPNR
ncbi:MAG: Spy/CpxP family protein refolding chaperone [Terriglobia bacterium]